MLTPALMQPLATRPTALPPSPVRPAGEPLSALQKAGFRPAPKDEPKPESRPTPAPQLQQQQQQADDRLSGWQAPARGDTAVAAQRIAQDESQPNTLTDEQLAVVADLRARDAEVRAHEQAHKAVGGRYAGAPRYDTVRGPDGQRYAIGGEVAIDVSPEGSPDETIAKMLVVKAAALAPAEPSPQDRRVAAMADAQRLQAMGVKREQERAEAEALRTPSEEGRSGADVLPFTYRKPPVPVLMRAMGAYGASLHIAGASPYAQRAESFDLVA